MASEPVKQKQPMEAVAKGEAVASVPSSPAANQHSNNSAKTKSASKTSSESGVRQRKRKPMTKQQRMLVQMKAQQKMEREQQAAEETQTNGALSSLLVKYVQAMSLVLLMAGVLLYTYAPGLVHKWFSRKPRLPTRSLLSVYPPHVALRRDLPRFFNQYSLATADNLATRQAVQHAQVLRQGATQAGSIYQQTIHVWPWELAQFRRQFSPQQVPMDAYCGAGTEAIFTNRPELREEILIWCLLATGHDDGMLRFGVQRVHGSVARGLQGVAVRYDGQPQRVHSASLLLLPLLDPVSLAEGKEMAPSTKVALHAMSWLRQNAALIANVDELVQGLEEYLYFVIRKEDDASWHWMQAACTTEERQAHVEAGDLRVATLCTEVQEAEGADCCVVYDPHWHTFFGRSKPNVAAAAQQAEGKDEH
jgi:hypothetical protein